MNPEKRQKILAGVLVALLVILGLRALSSRGSNSGRLDSSAGGTRRGAAEIALSELASLDLAALENKPGEFSLGRDPFRFYVPPRPRPPQPPPSRPAPAQPRPRPQARPQQAQKPRPPQIDVTFLGSFGPDRGRIGVFTDGADLYNARVGDVVKTHFIVDAIGYESADLGFVNFPDEPAQRLAAGG